MSYMAVAGLVMGAGGTFLKGRSGDIVRKRLGSIADTPGLDIEALSSEALKNQGRLLPEAQALVGQEATGRQALMDQLAEQSLPGWGAEKTKVKAIADQLLAGEVPRDVQEFVQRKTAANILGGVGGAGGFSGGSIGASQWGRNLGILSTQAQQQGLSWLNALRGMSPTATPQSAFGFTGPDASQFLNIRGNERTQRMNLLAGAAQIPGQTAAWGNWLSSTGGTLLGAGLTQNRQQQPGGQSFGGFGNEASAGFNSPNFAGGRPQGANQGTGEGTISTWNWLKNIWGQ